MFSNCSHPHARAEELLLGRRSSLLVLVFAHITLLARGMLEAEDWPVTQHQLHHGPALVLLAPSDSSHCSQNLLAEPRVFHLRHLPGQLHLQYGIVSCDRLAAFFNDSIVCQLSRSTIEVNVFDNVL